MIEQSLMVALSVIAWWAMMDWGDMIFSFVGDYLEDKFPKTLYKMLGGCILCAVPWIGSPIYFALFHNEFSDLWELSRFDAIADWLGTLLAAMGFNAISVLVIKFIRKYLGD